MRTPLVGLIIGLMMPLAQPPHGPQILQIYRDFLKPGTETRYREIEEDAARICARLGCPNPYLAIESLTGPTEVWYLNGYRSLEHEKAVSAGYGQNASLLTELQRITTRKSDLIGTPVNVRATFRGVLGRGKTWRPGHARFLIVTITRLDHGALGSVFEAEDGTRFVVASSMSREDAEVKARKAGGDARVFAVRPAMSMPDADWVATDPDFWRGRM